jgi:site-specific DNA recombinase
MFFGYNSGMDDELDVTKLKYVLYARKSTDDPERQVRSIPDQIAECQAMAERMGLRIVDILEESRSAKRADNRPVFTQMLEDLRAGKYDAVLAWHPDRLSRNSLEGGKVVHFVDEEIIKDLKFVTYHFSPDSSGKMLLGIAFVLSKEYSDKLSANVKRGLHRKVEEGRSHIEKHGYTRDEFDRHRPDNDTFELVRKAWDMRLEGESLEKIADYMNTRGYIRKTKTGKEIDMDKRILTKLFKDPFCYGILIQGSKQIDLREIYDFEPMITEGEYLAVQALTNRRIKPLNTNRKTFYPFKTFVHCAYCDGNMTVGPSSGSSRRYLYFRCETPGCERKKKSLRVKIVLEWLYEFLADGLNFTEADYEVYLKEMTDVITTRQTELKTELHSKQGLLKKVNREMNDIALKVLDFDKGSTVRKVNEQRITKLEAERAQLEQDIEDLKAEMPNVEQEVLSLEDFLNFSKNAGEYVKNGIPILKDQVVRIIFLNLLVDEENVLSYRLKEPFNTLLKDRVVLQCRRNRTRTCGLTLPKRAL